MSSKVHTLTQSTVYSTEYETVTSCAPTVTDCPARSTVTSSSVYLASTTLVSAVTETTPAATTPVATTPEATPETTTPEAASATSSNSPVGESAPPAAGSSKAVIPTVSVGGASSFTSVSPVLTTGGASVCVPSYSVKTISTSTTTVIPTVIYETVSVPCASATGGSSPVAYTTGSGSGAGNAT